MITPDEIAFLREPLDPSLAIGSATYGRPQVSTLADAVEGAGARTGRPGADLLPPGFVRNTPAFRRLPLAVRFALSCVEDDGCWRWVASCGADGYGQIGADGRRALRAHRVSYELFVGDMPEGCELDHLCRNRWCVNPDHLEPVSHRENGVRATSLITHCPRGHEYTPENTYYTPQKPTWRRCRECSRIAARDRRRREAARCPMCELPRSEQSGHNCPANGWQWTRWPR